MNRGVHQTKRKGDFARTLNHAQVFSDAAADLGMNEGAIKVAVHCLRQKFRELLRIEVANTRQWK